MITEKEIQEVIEYLKSEYLFEEDAEFICFNSPESAICSFNFDDVKEEGYTSVEELLDPDNGDGWNFDTMRNTPENLRTLIVKYYDDIKEVMDFVKEEKESKF